jgi:hypothetical protein
VTIPEGKGITNSSDETDKADKGRMHDVRNADTDFVV